MSVFRHISLLSKALFLLAITIAASAVPASAALNAQEQAIFNYMKSASGQRRAFLEVDPILSQVARARAQDMARRGYFGHTDPNGRGPNWHVRQAGYELPAHYNTAVNANTVESISAGRNTASWVWNDWMGSPGHRTHLLGEGFFQEQTSVGVGYFRDPNSEWVDYWVVITAPPQGPTLGITTPGAGAKLTSPEVTVAGTTGGVPAADRVEVRVENADGAGPWQVANGTSTWSLKVSGLTAGSNTLRVRSLSGGNVLKGAERSVRYVVMKPLTVNISGDGTVTKAFQGTTSREVGAPYTVVANANAGSIFAGWTGGITSTNPALSFRMVEGLTLTANFVPNPFPAHKGNYVGVITGDRPGQLKITTNAKGAVTGQVTYGGKVYALKGRLDINGNATLKVNRAGLSPLEITLSLDLDGGSGRINATISDGESQHEIAAVHSTGVDATNIAGRYTVVFPGANDFSGPAGNGATVLMISATGVAKFAGWLADGTPLSLTTRVTKNLEIPFYRGLYTNRGSMVGVLQLRDTSVSDVDGPVQWSRPQRPSHRLPEGFSTELHAVGSTYTAQPGSVPLHVTPVENNVVLELGAGNLEEAAEQPGTLVSTPRVYFNDPVLPGAKLTLNSVNGRVNGQFLHPATGQPTKVRGIVLQKQNAAFGFFVGVNRSGYAALGPSF